MQLKDWLEANRYTQVAFLKKMSNPPTRPTFNNWIHGRFPIPLSAAVEIQKLTRGQVRPQDWLDARKEASEAA
jgi:DNA-binding transcriptional regulator YdaS (Cro superfamily)